MLVQERQIRAGLGEEYQMGAKSFAILADCLGRRG